MQAQGSESTHCHKTFSKLESEFSPLLSWFGSACSSIQLTSNCKAKGDQTDTLIDSMALISAGKLVFACAIKWLASAQGVAGLVNLAFAWILLATSILEVVTAGNCDSCPNGCR